MVLHNIVFSHISHVRYDHSVIYMNTIYPHIGIFRVLSYAYYPYYGVWLYPVFRISRISHITQYLNMHIPEIHGIHVFEDMSLNILAWI